MKQRLFNNHSSDTRMLVCTSLDLSSRPAVEDPAQLAKYSIISMKSRAVRRGGVQRSLHVHQRTRKEALYKIWRNNREISPPPLPPVSCLPRRGDPTCSLTLPTDLTDNYFLFIGGYLHTSICLFVGFFLLVCVGFECFGGVDFSNDPLTIMKSCFSFILELWITKITPRILFA